MVLPVTATAKLVIWRGAWEPVPDSQLTRMITWGLVMAIVLIALAEIVSTGRMENSKKVAPVAGVVVVIVRVILTFVMSTRLEHNTNRLVGQEHVMVHTILKAVPVLLEIQMEQYVVPIASAPAEVVATARRLMAGVVVISAQKVRQLIVVILYVLI